MNESIRAAGEQLLAPQARTGRAWLGNLLPRRNSAGWVRTSDHRTAGGQRACTPALWIR
jgi:hypothetical protein